MEYDQIRNPQTNKYIEKYGSTWYYLLRNGYKEEKLESCPIFYNKNAIPQMKYVKDLNLDLLKPGRGGVILYTIINNNLRLSTVD